MLTSRKIGAYIAVLVVWIAYSRLIILFWGYYPNPILHWALDALIPEKRFLFYTLIYTHDLLLNILLALPVGYVFRRFTKWSLWGAVIATVSLVFLWDYRQVLWGEGSIIEFFSTFGAVLGVFYTVCVLPFAYFLTGKWKIYYNA